jgi:hypothetical protein
MQPSEHRKLLITTGLASTAVLGICWLVLPWYALVCLAVLFGILFVSTIKPEYGYYLVILVLMEEQVHLFVYMSNKMTFMFFPYKVVLLAVMLGWFVNRIIHQKSLRTSSGIDGLLYLIVAYELLSIFWTPAMLAGSLYGIYLLTNVMLYYMTLVIVSNEKILRKLVNVWIFAGVIIASGVVANQWLDGVTDYYFTPEVGLKFAFTTVQGRYSGFAGVDHAAGFISTAILLAISCIVYEKKWKLSAWLSIVLLFMFYALILAGTRGVLFGLIFALFCYSFLHPYLKGKTIRYSIGTVLVAFLLILIIRPGLIERIMVGFGYTGVLPFSGQTFYGHEAISQGEGISGFDVRFARWKIGFDQFARQPMQLLFGFGAAGFVYYCEGLGGPETVNICLSFLFDMGIFGIILLLSLVYVLFNLYRDCLVGSKWSYAHHMLITSIAMIIAEVVVHGLVDYDINSIGSKLPWLLLAFSMATLNIAERSGHSMADRS